LATGFGVDETQFADTAQGIVVPAESAGAEGLLAASTGQDLTGSQINELVDAEMLRLLELKEQIQAELVSAGFPDAAAYRIDSRGLTVRLVSANTFFVPNSAQLTGKARQIVDAIG